MTTFGHTFVGKKPADEKDERALVARLAAALKKGRTLELDDGAVQFAIVELLDRANYMIETLACPVGILAGREGIFVNGRRHALADEDASLEQELVRGMPARGLAGITFSEQIDQVEARALLAAWRLEPTRPRESLERMREVFSGERAGRGLAAAAPVDLVALPGDGKLPLPPPPPPREASDDDRYVPPDDDADNPLAKIAQRHVPKGDGEPEQGGGFRAGRTMLKKTGDVIEEDVAQAADFKRSRENRASVEKKAGSSGVEKKASSSGVEKKASSSGVEKKASSSGVEKRAGMSGIEKQASASGSSRPRKLSEAETPLRGTPRPTKEVRPQPPEPPEPAKPAEDAAALEYRAALEGDPALVDLRPGEEAAAAPAPAAGDDAANEYQAAAAEIAGSTAVHALRDVIPEDLLGKVPSFNEEIGEAPPEEGTPLSVDIVQEEPAPEAPAPIEDLSPDWAKATGAYARLAARSFRALEAPPEERDASMSSLRRAIVEIVSGMARTAFEDRILALTAAPVAEDARARHAANTAIFAVAAARACGVVKLALVDVGIAAALHDEGEAELLGKGDTWPRSVGRAISGAISDAAILHVVTAYEKTGARGTPARPAPQSKKTRLESRIIACACAFDEKTRAGGTTVETLEQLAAAGHDPAATRALSTALGKFPRGVLVSLSPLGHLGVVLACGARRDDKPRVRIFADEKGEPVDAREVEVGSARDLSVDRVVDPKKLGVSPLAHLLAWG